MDDHRFDTLLRSLSRSSSRRSGMRLVAGSALGGLLAPVLGREDAAAHNALKKCDPKLKSKPKKYKKCIKEAKKHNAQHKTPPPPVDCAPNCFVKLCGSDGCGGSCGTCPAGGTCCPSGEICCPAGEENCTCCPAAMKPCPDNSEGFCCSEDHTCCPANSQRPCCAEGTRCCPEGTGGASGCCPLFQICCASGCCNVV